MILTMFLASGYILGPVAGVSLLVVEQPTDTELLGGGSVPAGPVASAGGLVPEYSVQPVTVLRALGGIWEGTNIKISFSSQHLTTRIQPTICFVFDISRVPLLPPQ